MTSGPRIVVDARALHGPLDGIGRWTAEMLPRLRRELPGDYWLAFPGEAPAAMPAGLEALPVSAGRWRLPGTLWLQLELPVRLRELAADLLLAPLAAVPTDSSTPSVVVVHDLTALEHPERHTWRVRLSLLPFWGTTLRRATRVVAPSAATAAALLTLDPGCAATVVPNGVDARFHPPRAGESPPHTRPYVLFLGTIEPRKELGALVAAMEALWERGATTADLLVAGRTGWRSQSVLAAIERSAHRSRIRLLGHVLDAELPTLIGAAELLVFPSVAEGFGLPVLEAMACGTAVIARDLPVIREVAADAVQLVGPDAPLAPAIAALLGDAAKRQSLGNRGWQQAQSWSWDRSARILADVCRTALDPSAR